MILDIILVVLFILVMLYGYKKGCISVVAKLVSVIVALILAYLLADVVGGFIEQTSVGEKIQISIQSLVEEKLNTAEDDIILMTIQDKLNVENELSIIEKIMEYIFLGLGFVTVFLASRIVLYIIEKILESIFELPVLKTFNKLGGVVASVVLFLIEVSILLAIIQSLSTLAFMANVVNIIDTSIITKVIYDHNIFTTLIISKLF